MQLFILVLLNNGPQSKIGYSEAHISLRSHDIITPVLYAGKSTLGSSSFSPVPPILPSRPSVHARQHKAYNLTLRVSKTPIGSGIILVNHLYDWL